MGGHLFQFAILLGVLGLAAVLSISLRLPVVPFYIGAGLVLGRWIGPDEVVHFLGSLGVVFLLFFMGLEFSRGSLTRSPRRFLSSGGIDLLICFPLGLVLGRIVGWSWVESYCLAGVLYMSSSAVVSKCIVDFGRAARPETETILSILVFEDLVIAGYLILLNALMAGGPELNTGAMALELVRAAGFVALLILLARRFGDPLERLLSHRTEEAFTLVLFAFVLLIASSAIAVGVSEAVGAFLAGLVVGSTGLRERAAGTLLPFQTLFAALFFVSFGMGVELEAISGVLGPALGLIAIGIVSKIAAGFLAGRALQHPPYQAAVIGLSLVPKGEFSILIAAMAGEVARGDSSLELLTALYVVGLSILGPLGMREADRLWELVRPRET
ncbi:MAG: cation:proton antiporter [Myxococcota bacterium]